MEGSVVLDVPPGGGSADAMAADATLVEET